MWLSGKRQARVLYERALQRLLPVCDALPIGGGDVSRGRGRDSGRANAKLAKYHFWSRAMLFFSSMLHVVLHGVADTQQLLLLSSAYSFSASADLMLTLTAANSCDKRVAVVVAKCEQRAKREREKDAVKPFRSFGVVLYCVRVCVNACACVYVCECVLFLFCGDCTP